VKISLFYQLYAPVHQMGVFIHEMTFCGVNADLFEIPHFVRNDRHCDFLIKIFFSNKQQ